MRTRAQMLQDARDNRRESPTSLEACSLLVSLAEAKLILSAHGARVSYRFTSRREGNKVTTVVILRYRGESFSWAGKSSSWAWRILEKKRSRRKRTRREGPMMRTRKQAEKDEQRRILKAARRCLGDGRGVVSIRLIRESGAAYRDSDDEPPLSVQETARVIVNGGRICRRLKGHVLVDDGENAHICRDVVGLRRAGMIR